MDAISSIIPFDASEEWPPVIGGDWLDPDAANMTVFHRPTGILFQVGLTANAADPLYLGCRVLHICDGQTLPDAASLHRLGNAAIRVFLAHMAALLAEEDGEGGAEVRP